MIYRSHFVCGQLLFQRSAVTGPPNHQFSHIISTGIYVHDDTRSLRQARRYEAVTVNWRRSYTYRFLKEAELRGLAEKQRHEYIIQNNECSSQKKRKQEALIEDIGEATCSPNFPSNKLEVPKLYGL